MNTYIHIYFVSYIFCILTRFVIYIYYHYCRNKNKLNYLPFVLLYHYTNSIINRPVFNHKICTPFGITNGNGNTNRAEWYNLYFTCSLLWRNLHSHYLISVLNFSSAGYHNVVLSTNKTSRGSLKQNYFTPVVNEVQSNEMDNKP